LARAPFDGFISRPVMDVVQHIAQKSVGSFIDFTLPLTSSFIPSPYPARLCTHWPG
jgi:hypothetical protein